MTVRQTAIELAISSSNDHPMNGHVDHTSIPQTTAVLPFDFDTFLDGDIAKHNAFYALSNLFQHAAFSEMQVLSLLGWRIKCEMDTLETGGAHQTHSLGNLQCFRNALDRRVSYIRDTLRAVRSNEHPKWPARSQDRVEVALIAEKLIEDYEEMLAMALDLCQRCSEGMGIMMNLAVVAESQKSIELAQRLKKLTVLASFFIPLTFTCSLFGMNFREFGQGNLHVWLFVIVAIPMVTLSFFFYTYDMADSYRASVDRVSRLWRFRRSPL